jgi:hypothetical protein
MVLAALGVGLLSLAATTVVVVEVGTVVVVVGVSAAAPVIPVGASRASS